MLKSPLGGNGINIEEGSHWDAGLVGHVPSSEDMEEVFNGGHSAPREVWHFGQTMAAMRSNIYSLCFCF